MTTATAVHLSQDGQDAKSAALRAARAVFEQAGVPFRVGRMARLIGQALNRDEDLNRLVHYELRAEAKRVGRPPLRNIVGVIDPTGQHAAARVDAEREVRQQKNAPAAGGNQREGEDQNQSLHKKGIKS